jgi:hypothetical protein
MSIKIKKIISYFLVIILILLLAQQLLILKTNIEKNYQLKSTNQSALNELLLLKIKYSKKAKKTHSSDSQNDKQEFDYFLNEIQSYNLKLINYQKNKSELALNLTGDFTSILYFLTDLEKNFSSLKLKRLKLQKNSNKLVLFLKIKRLKRVDLNEK